MTDVEILQAMERIIKPVLTKIEEVKTELEERMDRMEEHMDRIEERMDRMEEHMSHMEERMDRMEERMSHMEERMDRIEDRMTGIEVHLETTTDVGIKIIGEGHADLTRKLDEALKVENERELLLIRLNYLEGEVVKVKRRLSQLEKTA